MWRNYEKNTQVANVDADMQPLIRSLFNAILCVKDKYLYWTTENKERFAYVERSFAYELYFRWKIEGNSTIDKAAAQIKSLYTSFIRLRFC